MIRLIALICAVAFTTMLVGCNTVEGAGKDIKASGNAIENAANKAKPD